MDQSLKRSDAESRNKEDIIEYWSLLDCLSFKCSPAPPDDKWSLTILMIWRLVKPHKMDLISSSLLYGEPLQKKTRTWTHMVTPRGFQGNHALTNTFTSGNRIGYISAGLITDGTLGLYLKSHRIIKNIVPTMRQWETRRYCRKDHQEPSYHYHWGNVSKEILPRSDYLFKCRSSKMSKLYIDPKTELRNHYQQVISPQNLQDFILNARNRLRTSILRRWIAHYHQTTES